MMINSTMESRNSVGDIEELKRISIKIFDVSGEKFEDDTFQANEVDDDAASTADYETEELTCAIQKPRSGKAKPKAGNLERSAQSTKSLFGGVEKVSAGENQRTRCHKYGHWWRDCPIPFGGTVVFQKAKAGKPKQGKSAKGPNSGKGSRKGKGGISTVEESTENDEAAELNLTVDEPTQVVEESWYDTEGNPVEDEEYWYNDAQWMSTFVSHECIETTGYDWWRTDVLPVGQGFGMIDSGAIASVCGKQWFGHLNKGQPTTALLKSDKIFRFGDGLEISSL